MLDVLGLGSGCQDLLINLSSLPGETGKERKIRMSWQGGGKVPSGVVASARLGGNCGIIATYGNGIYGQFQKTDFERHHIDVSHLLYDENCDTTLVCPVTVIGLPDRYFFSSELNAPRDAHRVIKPEDLDKEYIQSAKILLISSYGETEKTAAGYIREAGGRVVVDADSYREGADEAASWIDYFIPSEFYYNNRYGSRGISMEDALKDLKARGPRCVIFTMGEKGLVGIDDEGMFALPAFHVDAVDTTGAGDVFHGAFAYCMSQGMNPREAARLSSAVSAIKCTRIGGRVGIPTMPVVRKFMETGEIDYSEIDKRVEFYKIFRPTHDLDEGYPG